MEGMTTKSTAFIFTLGSIIRPLYSTCQSPAVANIGLKTIAQSAIGKQVSIQDWLTPKRNTNNYYHDNHAVYEESHPSSL